MYLCASLGGIFIGELLVKVDDVVQVKWLSGSFGLFKPV